MENLRRIPFGGSYRGNIYVLCIITVLIKQEYFKSKIMIHTNAFKSNSRKIQTECGLANLYADW